MYLPRSSSLNYARSETLCFYDQIVVRDRWEYVPALFNRRHGSFCFQSRPHHDMQEVIAGK